MIRTRFYVPWCFPVRFEQFRQVFDSGPPASPELYMAPVAESSSAYPILGTMFEKI